MLVNAWMTLKLETGYCRLSFKWIWPCTLIHDLMNRYLWMSIVNDFTLWWVSCFGLWFNHCSTNSHLFIFPLLAHISCFLLHCLGLMFWCRFRIGAWTEMGYVLCAWFVNQCNTHELILEVLGHMEIMFVVCMLNFVSIAMTSCLASRI